VQQHVLVGQAAGGALQMPAMIRFWVANGRITRLEEYLDTRQAMVLYGPA
jgi:ketosteroid isomerase-like protein